VPKIAAVDEPILEYVKRRLEEFKGDWPQISEESGVNIWTVRNIASGKSDNPEIANLQPLIDWFAAKDAMMARLRATVSSS
jgi:hypothetical protein